MGRQGCTGQLYKLDFSHAGVCFSEAFLITPPRYCITLSKNWLRGTWPPSKMYGTSQRRLPGLMWRRLWAMQSLIMCARSQPWSTCCLSSFEVEAFNEVEPFNELGTDKLRMFVRITGLFMDQSGLKPV